MPDLPLLSPSKGCHLSSREPWSYFHWAMEAQQEPQGRCFPADGLWAAAPPRDPVGRLPEPKWLTGLGAADAPHQYARRFSRLIQGLMEVNRSMTTQASRIQGRLLAPPWLTAVWGPRIATQVRAFVSPVLEAVGQRDYKGSRLLWPLLVISAFSMKVRPDF